MSLLGSSAPDFELPDQHGIPVRLSALRGHAVVLVFFPFAFTTGCTSELRALQDELLPTVNAGTQVLAVSCDSMFALRTFGDTEGLGFPLLSDYWPHGAVARSYGVLDDDRGAALRGTFVIDSAGTVRWTVVNSMADTRDVARYRRALDELRVA